MGIVKKALITNLESLRLVTHNRLPCRITDNVEDRLWAPIWTITRNRVAGAIIRAMKDQGYAPH